MTNATKVLDTSCGWGDRLTGFYTTPNAKEYVGCDPNGNVWIKYIDMVRRYEKLLGSEPVIDIQDDVFRSVGHKTVTIYRSGAEIYLGMRLKMSMLHSQVHHTSQLKDTEKVETTKKTSLGKYTTTTRVGETTSISQSHRIRLTLCLKVVIS